MARFSSSINAADVNPERVMVWWAPVAGYASRQHQDAMSAMLSREERARASRFLRAEDSQSFVLAHALARVMLSRFASVDPAAWQFSEGEFGKPAVAAPANAGLEFNLSHTRGLVACVVAWNRAAGVDVEPLARDADCAALAPTVFSPWELSEWQKLPSEARPRGFLEYWTLKEAYIKACGLGLSLPLDSFSIILRDGDDPRIEIHPPHNDEPERWQFRREELQEQYLLAVAVEVEPGTPVEFEIREAPGLV